MSGDKRLRWRVAIRGAAALTLVLVALLFARLRCGDEREVPEDRLAKDRRSLGQDLLQPEHGDQSERTAKLLSLRRPTSGRPAPRPPFALHPADPGAWTFEDLSEDERAEIAKIQEWAELDHGREVHERWRDASARAMVRFRARRAARAVGLEGVVGLGVLP